jgi:2-dehydropantoate 2-reductase
MPALTATHYIPTLLFMLNNPLGSTQLIRALGQDRVLLGFPGAGGTREGQMVRYAMIAQQPTTLGELSGRRTARLRNLIRVFRVSGFRTRTASNIDAWLKAHAFFATAVSGAIYLAGGDCQRLSEDSAALKLMTNGVREGFTAMRALGLTVTPFPLKVLFTWMPQAFAVQYWRRFFAAEMGDYVMGRHARAASAEMHEVANDCRMLLGKKQAIEELAPEEKEELREWLDGYDPAMEREWAAIAQERIRQIKSGEVTPLDGEQVLKEMRQLAKQLAQQYKICEHSPTIITTASC